MLFVFIVNLQHCKNIRYVETINLIIEKEKETASAHCSKCYLFFYCPKMFFESAEKTNFHRGAEEGHVSVGVVFRARGRSRKHVLRLRVGNDIFVYIDVANANLDSFNNRPFPGVTNVSVSSRSSERLEQSF